MTIREAIAFVDELKPNTYSVPMKVKWLSTLDKTIVDEIFSKYGDTSSINCDYREEDDLDTELLAPAPHDEMYLTYLEMKMDYYNTEYGKYNNDTVLFDMQYSAFAKNYNRKNKPIGKKVKFF